MLVIVVPGVEMYDEAKNEFVTVGDRTLELEHSLVSLSKWESIHQKPFLGRDEKTAEEMLSYVKMMTLTSNVPEDVFLRLSDENMRAISTYLESKMSATWFNDPPGPKGVSREVITAELIYYWMVTFNIPFECERWHLNRLFTLIRVCNVKQSKPKKMSRAEIARRNQELNAQRRQQLGTKG